MAVYIDNQGGAWAIADPSADSVQAADPVAVQQLASINARLSRKLATIRNGVAVLAERIKSERE